MENEVWKCYIWKKLTINQFQYYIWKELTINPACRSVIDSVKYWFRLVRGFWGGVVYLIQKHWIMSFTYFAFLLYGTEKIWVTLTLECSATLVLIRIIILNSEDWILIRLIRFIVHVSERTFSSPKCNAQWIITVQAAKRIFHVWSTSNLLIMKRNALHVRWRYVFFLLITCRCGGTSILRE